MLSLPTFIVSNMRKVGAHRWARSLGAIAFSGLGFLMLAPAALAHHPLDVGCHLISLRVFSRVLLTR